VAHRYDFNLVKTEVTMPMVLGFLGIELQERGKTLRGQCPFQNGSGHGKDAFIAFETGWQCHSCGKKGNVLRFVAEKLGLTSDWEAAKWCYDTFGLEETVGPANAPQNRLGNGVDNDAGRMNDHSSRMTGSSARKIGLNKGSNSTSRPAEPDQKPEPQVEAEVESSPKPETNKPLAFALKGITPQHPFLETRGFLPTHAEQLGAGFFPGKGSMSGRFVFPIHNQQGELVAYAGRALADQEPRWKLPEGFKKSLVLYNLNRVLGVPGESVVVVESFWGVMACVRAGVMNSVASMGRTISDAQLDLVRQFPKITLLMDGDEPGRLASVENGTRLLGLPERREVRIVFLPPDAQPDHLSVEDLRKVLGELS
jgi:DNA primase